MFIICCFRNQALSPTQQLLLTLCFYATGAFLANCADFSGVDKSTASRVIRKVSHHLALLRPQFINFPETAEEIADVRRKFYNIAKFPRCIGAVDCTHVKIQSPGGENAEIYRNRKGYFSFNVQSISDANLRIQDIVCRWPGSTHDSTIFNNSSIRGKFENNEMGDNLLVGDSGYALKRYLMTPFSDPRTEGQNRYNESQIRTRNPVERSYGAWKRRFPILAKGIRVNINSVESIVVATAVLNNIANHFGDATPSVMPSDEQYIELGQFGTGNLANNDVDPGVGLPVSVRNSLVRYFESL